MKTLIALLFAAAAMSATEPEPMVINRDTLPKLTSTGHRTEAERHAARAMDFARKAAKHEEAAEKIKAKQSYNAMRHKWPGLANGPYNRENDRAMQARRAEAESRELASYHAEMAKKAAAEAP